MKKGILLLLSVLCIISLSGCKSEAKGEVVECFNRFSFTVPYTNEEMKKKGYSDNYYEGDENAYYDDGYYGWECYSEDGELEKYLQIEWYYEDYYSIDYIVELYTDCTVERISKSSVDCLIIYDIPLDDPEDKCGVVYISDPLENHTFSVGIVTDDQSCYSNELVKQLADSIVLDFDDCTVNFFDAYKFKLPFSNTEMEKNGFYLAGISIDEENHEGQLYWESEEDGFMVEYWIEETEDDDAYYKEMITDNGLEVKDFSAAGLSGFYGIGADMQQTEYDLYFGAAFLQDKENQITYAIAIQSTNEELLTEEIFKKVISSIKQNILT